MVQAVKKGGFIPKHLLPLTAIVIGLLLGLASVPIFNVTIAIALWSGGVSGLASVGLFEIGKHTKDSAEERKHIKKMESDH